MNEKGQIRQEYIKRINKVINFIETNLDQELPLEYLSKKAYFSPFHFHRIFSAIIGETLNTYINRKRIERIASVLLSKSDIPITELANKYGFNNGSSFSRAFKNFYGISPTEFKTKSKNKFSKIGKANSKNGIALITIEKYICSIDNIKKWILMNAQVEIVELQEIKLVGITHIGKFDKIGETYERLIKWAEPNGLLTQKMKAVTIYHDNPKITKTSKVRLSACITADKETKTDGEIAKVSIQKGIYAIGRFEISVKLFEKAWDSMIIWVTENGYKFRDGDFFEIYQNDNKTHPEKKFIVDICIPIEKSQHTNHQVSIGNLGKSKSKPQTNQTLTDYKRTLNYVKELRLHFTKEYPLRFKVGTIYQGSTDYSYFPIKTEPLKKEKLKFVIIINHQKRQFEICLSGQNKEIRKKYWKIFKGSNWKKYHIPSTSGLSIIESILVENPDFNNLDLLTEQIETKTMEFINEITDVLE